MGIADSWRDLTVAQAVIVVAVVWVLWQVGAAVVDHRRQHRYDADFNAERSRREREEQLLRTLVDYAEDQGNELQSIRQALDVLVDEAQAEPVPA